ncbi:hypothetical protein FRC01_001502 [Tulasnella sp. 417]|nr:hypothetical protein FRC01_001502 [Tulasnella sp. 417]
MERSLFDCFRLAAPRIGRLSVHIRHPFSLHLVNILLTDGRLPGLININVLYDDEENQVFDRYISLPLNGASLRSISLTGVQTQPWCQFDLGNLTSLYLGTGERWKWLRSSIVPLLQASTSLQELHFVGDKGMFRTAMDEGFDGFHSTLPALRRVRFVNTAPGFIFTFFRAVNTPLLEEVDMTAPSHRTHNNEGGEIFSWTTAVRSVLPGPAVSPSPKTLKLRDGDVKYNEKNAVHVLVFLAAVFPNITFLEIGGGLLLILDALEQLATRQRAGLPKPWFLERLKVYRHVDQAVEGGHEDIGKSLTRTLRSLELAGVMSLKELRLGIDRPIHLPVGTDSLDALKELVGELILDE